jgi:hypothetical protein
MQTHNQIPLTLVSRKTLKPDRSLPESNRMWESECRKVLVLTFKHCQHDLSHASFDPKDS